ncbi:MAG: hypothetical protein U0Q16_39225 [Bryobacteraceae bacterium]
MILGAAAGLAVASLYNWLVPEEYVSVATIHLTSSLIPDRFVALALPLDLDYVTSSVFMEATSRNSLTNVIQTHDLLRSERARQPMEDVIEQFRKRIEVRNESATTLRLSVRLPDSQQAQLACRDLLSRVMDATMRQRETQAKALVSFLGEESRQAADEWDAFRKQVRGQIPADRAALEANMAQKRYESLSAKLADARMLAAMERRKQGPALEVLDPPSLPEHPANVSHAMALMAGLAGGLGLVLALEAVLWAWRQRRSPLQTCPS